MHSRHAIDRLKSAFVDRFGRASTLGTRAPGRVDLMGSHTDYNLGLVMTLAIDRDTIVLATPTDDGLFTIYSENLRETISFPVPGDIPAPRQHDNHQSAKVQHESGVRLEGWGRYVQAVVLAAIDDGLTVRSCTMLVHTNVPIGGGLSSSAALECAILRAILEISGDERSLVSQSRICQRAENRYVGVQCGILDQFSSIMAAEGSVVVLDCRDLTHEAVPVPKGISFVVCDTNAPRSLNTSEYGTRREQCEQGVRLLGEHSPGVDSLRDVSLHDFERWAGVLPEVVRRRCRFIVEENARVLALADAIRVGDRAAIGRLFGSSFAGARDLYEITVPAMEAMISSMELAPGCIGARQAGAGFGGCMVAAVETKATEAFAAAISASYEASTGICPEVYPVSAAQGASRLM